jgi:hypothetical protein
MKSKDLLTAKISRHQQKKANKRDKIGRQRIVEKLVAEVSCCC